MNICLPKNNGRVLKDYIPHLYVFFLSDPHLYVLALHKYLDYGFVLGKDSSLLLV